MLGNNNKEEIKRLREKIFQKTCQIDEFLKEEEIRLKNNSSSVKKRTKITAKK